MEFVDCLLKACHIPFPQNIVNLDLRAKNALNSFMNTEGQHIRADIDLLLINNLPYPLVDLLTDR